MASNIRQMRVLACGGRTFDDSDFIFGQLDRLYAEYGFCTLIEGDARGVDRIAGEWAQTRGVALIKFPADWKNEGRHAALMRNVRMLREGSPDLVIAFPGGNGTYCTCRLAEELGIPGNQGCLFGHMKCGRYQSGATRPSSTSSAPQSI
jgi:hypothetical protein